MIARELLVLATEASEALAHDEPPSLLANWRRLVVDVIQVLLVVLLAGIALVERDRLAIIILSVGAISGACLYVLARRVWGRNGRGWTRRAVDELLGRAEWNA